MTGRHDSDVLTPTGKIQVGGLTLVLESGVVCMEWISCCSAARRGKDYETYLEAEARTRSRALEHICVCCDDARGRGAAALASKSNNKIQ